MPPVPAISSTHSTGHTVVTTVHVPQTVTTVTSTLGSPSSVPTVAAISMSSSSEVPIAAIAGGTAAGVVLALAAVIGWTWWGRCIKRQAAKERREALAYLKVRENTRKNSTTSTRPSVQPKAEVSKGTQQDRKVTFVSTAPSSAQSTLRGTTEPETASAEPEKVVRPPPPPVPRPPTPTAHLRIHKKNQKKPDTGLPLPPPPVPCRNPRRSERHVVTGDAATSPDSYTQHRLMHQASTLSSASEYSTQSAAEERNSGVPASLLMALTSEGSRRSFLVNYLPWNRHRLSTTSGNRLSEYSTASGYSQFDDQPWEQVGFAYSGEDNLPPQ